MTTRILEPDAAGLAEAARVLRAGGLVAFPTETVYGLGAHALDEDAVDRIFVAKGRPADNPLIVHVDGIASARELASPWTPAADDLGGAHWPGPLTLVVRKDVRVPDRVTASGPTVALRVPDHPVAQALLREAALPIAAPSANRSEQVSPTTAQHVVDSLGPVVDDLIVLDGGSCAVGIESTVVDVTTTPPRLLRPGMLSVGLAVDEAGNPPVDGPARSPGQRMRHYAPSKPLRIVDAASRESTLEPGAAWIDLPTDPERAGAMLYAELRRLEADPAVLRILVEEPPAGPAWAAIRDRLSRASSE